MVPLAAKHCKGISFASPRPRPSSGRARSCPSSTSPNDVAEAHFAALARTPQGSAPRARARGCVVRPTESRKPRGHTQISQCFLALSHGNGSTGRARHVDGEPVVVDVGAGRLVVAVVELAAVGHRVVYAPDGVRVRRPAAFRRRGPLVPGQPRATGHSFADRKQAQRLSPWRGPRRRGRGWPRHKTGLGQNRALAILIACAGTQGERHSPFLPPRRKVRAQPGRRTAAPRKVCEGAGHR